MRPTVNDIAREAGVSLATVDRVLNARPGVRAKTIQAVQDAIARIGYVRDVAAANLARQRDYRLAFVLPDTDSQFTATLLDALAEADRLSVSARTDVVLRRFPAEDPHALAHLLAELPEEGVVGVAVMAPETPILRDAIRALKSKGLAVVALVSDLPNTERDHFVGIDNRAAGRTAAVLMGRFLGRRPRPRSWCCRIRCFCAKASSGGLASTRSCWTGFRRSRCCPRWKPTGRRHCCGGW